MGMQLPSATPVTEPRWPREWLKRWSERSVEHVTVKSGENLKSGAVVGALDLGLGGIVGVLSGTSPGNGTMTDIYAGPDVEAGAYLVQCTAIAAHGGTFSITTPSGKLLPPLVMTAGAGVATQYRSRHINFTMTDGSTDFALTALWTVTVSTTAPLVLGGTGTGTISAITPGPKLKQGRYLVIVRSAVAEGGDVEVLDPDNNSIGRFLMGTTSTGSATFTSEQISFTLTDATDFIAGNRFNIASFKLATAGKVVAWDPSPSSYDGRQRVRGILLDPVNATAGDATGVVICRDAEVILSLLTFLSTVPDGEQALAASDLKALGILIAA